MANTDTDEVAAKRRAAGAAVARALRAKGATAANLAALLGVTEPTLAYWASGIQNPPASRADAVLRILAEHNKRAASASKGGS